MRPTRDTAIADASALARELGSIAERDRAAVEGMAAGAVITWRLQGGAVQQRTLTGAEIARVLAALRGPPP